MSEPASLSPETAAATPPVPKKGRTKRNKLSQERVMLFLVFAFISGVAVYIATPPDSAMRDAAVASYIAVLMFIFFKLAA